LTIRPERSLSDNAGCEPHSENEDSPVDALPSGEFGLWFRYRHENGPDEATEFSGDGSDGHVTMFAFIKPEKFIDQTELRLHGNGDDLGWLSLTSSFENKGSSSVVAVVPGNFDQETAHVDIAGLCDGPAVLSIAGRVLRRDEAEVGHE
jgi:hypothetical protein